MKAILEDDTWVWKNIIKQLNDAKMQLILINHMLKVIISLTILAYAIEGDTLAILAHKNEDMSIANKSRK